MTIKEKIIARINERIANALAAGDTKLVEIWTERKRLEEES